MGLILLCFRSRDGKEVEILVLRHELEVLRRQHMKPRVEPKDRALLAALSRLVPRQRWSAFLVTPATPLGWHRRIVRRHWTYPNARPRRPPLAAEVQSLIVRLATENPRWVVNASRVNCRPRLPRVGLLHPTGAPGPRHRPGPSPGSHDVGSFLRQQAAGIVACDFFAVDTVWLTRYSVLFFIEVETPTRLPRRHHHQPDRALGHPPGSSPGRRAGRPGPRREPPDP